MYVLHAVFWIWFRMNPHWFLSAGSGSGSRRAKKTHKSSKSSEIFMFWSAGWYLLSAEGFCCCLDFSYGGLGITKLQLFIKNATFYECKFFPVFDHQNLGSVSGPYWLKICWIRIHIGRCVTLVWYMVSGGEEDAKLLEGKKRVMEMLRSVFSPIGNRQGKVCVMFWPIRGRHCNKKFSNVCFVVEDRV